MTEKVTAVDIKIALADKHKDEFFITECKNGPSGVAKGQLLKFDAVAIYKNCVTPRIIGYEVKVNRQDFLNDIKFYNYLPYFHEFSFVAPIGLISKGELPEGVGLIQYNPEKKSLWTVKKAKYTRIEPDANMLLYIIAYRLDSDRYPFFNSKAEFFREWLEKKRDNWQLGRLVSSKIRRELIRLEREIDRIECEGESDLVKKIVEVMERHGISVRSTDRIPSRLDKVLQFNYPKELDALETRLRAGLVDISKIKERGAEQNEKEI